MSRRSLELGEPLPLSYRPKKEPTNIHVKLETNESEEPRQPIRLGGLRRRYGEPQPQDPHTVQPHTVQPPLIIPEEEPYLGLESDLKSSIVQAEVDRQLAAVSMVEENLRFVRELVELGHPVSVERLMEILEILTKVLDTLTPPSKSYRKWIEEGKRYGSVFLKYAIYLSLMIIAYFMILALYLEYIYRMD